MRALIKSEHTINLVLLISALVLAGCSEQIDEANAPVSVEEASLQGSASELMDDAEYLVQLALMKGHLLVGRELYEAGHIDHAKMHMKHPESELYSIVKPVLDIKGSSGFADQLKVMAEAVELEKEDDLVELAYVDVVSAIQSSENLVVSGVETIEGRLDLVASILEVAAEEYAIAVVDGRMKNAHEYQDAYGFTKVAESKLKSLEFSQPEQQDKAGKALMIISSLKPLWPALVPPEFLETDAAQLYEAAFEIEQLANEY